METAVAMMVSTSIPASVRERTVAVAALASLTNAPSAPVDAQARMMTSLDTHRAFSVP